MIPYNIAMSIEYNSQIPMKCNLHLLSIRQLWHNCHSKYLKQSAPTLVGWVENVGMAQDIIAYARLQQAWTA